jgi:hypothetical protein
MGGAEDPSGGRASALAMLSREPRDASEPGAHLGNLHEVDTVQHEGGREYLALLQDLPDENARRRDACFLVITPLARKYAE